MKEIVKYLKEIEAEIMERDSEVDVAEVPEILQDFYRKIESVDLPFGRIYELEFALNNSKRMPFYPEWFVFGQDNYSSFWLCYRGKSEDGCYFTYWDHESGLGIEEPVWEDLISFLSELEEDYKGEW